MSLLLGAAGGPCPEMPGWLAGGLRLGPHHPMVYPAYADPRMLHAYQSHPPYAKRRGGRLYVPPQPLVLFACSHFLDVYPVSLAQRNPVFPLSQGTCPLGEYFLGEVEAGMGEEGGFAQAAPDIPQNSPVIPVPDVHRELSLFSSFSAAGISSGCCRGYLHPPACCTLC